MAESSPVVQMVHKDSNKPFELICWSSPPYDFVPFWGLKTNEEVHERTRTQSLQVLKEKEGIIFTSKALLNVDAHGVVRIYRKGSDGKTVEEAFSKVGATVMIRGTNACPVNIVVTSDFAMLTIATFKSPMGMEKF